MGGELKKQSKKIGSELRLFSILPFPPHFFIRLSAPPVASTTIFLIKVLCKPKSHFYGEINKHPRDGCHQMHATRYLSVGQPVDCSTIVFFILLIETARQFRFC